MKPGKAEFLTSPPKHAGCFDNLHGYTVHQWYQTLYSPTNAHVEFIKTN